MYRKKWCVRNTSTLNCDDFLSYTCSMSSYLIFYFFMQRIKHPVHDQTTEKAQGSPAVLLWHANPTAWTYILLLITGNSWDIDLWACHVNRLLFLLLWLHLHLDILPYWSLQETLVYHLNYETECNYVIQIIGWNCLSI